MIGRRRCTGLTMDRLLDRYRLRPSVLARSYHCDGNSPWLGGKERRGLLLLLCYQLEFCGYGGFNFWKSKTCTVILTWIKTQLVESINFSASSVKRGFHRFLLKMFRMPLSQFGDKYRV